MIENWTKIVNMGKMVVQLKDSPPAKGYLLTFFLDSMELSSKTIDNTESVKLREALVISGYQPLAGEKQK